MRRPIYCHTIICFPISSTQSRTIPYIYIYRKLMTYIKTELPLMNPFYFLLESQYFLHIKNICLFDKILQIQ